MQKISLNENWIVKGVSASIMNYVAGDAGNNSHSVTLPHDAMIETVRRKENPGGGALGFFEGGDYEYTRKLTVSKEDKGKTFVIEFEGIYHSGRVFINNEFVGSVRYGYTGMMLDISSYLSYGQENEILVKVTNSDQPNTRWYTGSGIYRPVNLYIGGPIHVKENGLKITTPELDKDIALVIPEISISYNGKERRTIQIKTVLLDASGSEAAQEVTKATLFSGKDLKIKQRIYVKNPELWSTDSPALYTCKVQLMENEVILDETESTFGIRKITVDSIHGLRLNGETVLLRGACIHHDLGPLGAAAFEKAEERRIRKMKEAGFNSIRMAHNSSSKALLNACDKLGMLVLEESFDTWNVSKNPYDYSLDFAHSWKRDVEDIVEKDFNHPCVFMYAIGNEISEIGTPTGAALNREMADYFRKLDPMRFVTNAMNGTLCIMDELPQLLISTGMMTVEQMMAMQSAGAENADINDVMTALMGHMKALTNHPVVTDKLSETYSGLDICGYNYMLDVYENYQKLFPNQIFYGSETYGPEIDLLWKKVKDIPACIGDYTWTGWDYLGEAGVGIVTYEGSLAFLKDYPAYVAYCGDIDITGYRRPMSYYREIVYGLRKEPYIVVQLPEHYGKKANCTPWAGPYAVESWSWPGYEGKPCVVEVYSDAEEIELLINGKSIGREKAGEENRYKALFTVEYEPGEVRAIAYRKGVACEQFELKTPGEQRKLTLIADQQTLKADGQDLCYVDILVTDENGIIDMSGNANVKVCVEGNALLVALASADPESTENFFDDTRAAFYGRAQAILRAGFTAGTAHVSVQAEGYDPVTMEIKIVE